MDIEIDNDRTCLKIRNPKEDSSVTVHFKDCHFNGTNNVSLKNVNLNQLHITGGTKAKGFNFGFLEPKPLTWQHTFMGIPIKHSFKGIHSVSNDTVRDEETWAFIYASLKAKADKDGEKQLGNDYFFWQQYLQQKNETFNRFYLWTSAYGLSPLLPCLYFVFFIALFTVFYMVILATLDKSVGLHFRASLLLSLKTSVSLLTLAPIPLPYPEHLVNTHKWIPLIYFVISSLQKLTQAFLIFQIGAAIRNKVKR